MLAPEAARDSRAQILDDLEEAGGEDLKIDLLFGDTAGDSGFELAGAGRARAILLMPSTSGPIAAEAADVEVTQAGLALLDYLKEQEANPLVRLLFRRGRNVDASWELFPPEWDAVVGDRTVSALLRLAITRPPALEKLPGWVAEHGSVEPFTRLVDASWKASVRAEGPLRLTIVGCGINAPALMEDLAEVGTETFAVTMIAPREVFDRYLGSAEPSGVKIHFIEARPTETDHLPRNLIESRPHMVIVTPSPSSWDQRASDASATLSVLHVLRTAGGRDLPVLAELLPLRVGQAPAQRPPPAGRLHPALDRRRGRAQPLRPRACGRAGAPARRRRGRSLRIDAWRRSNSAAWSSASARSRRSTDSTSRCPRASASACSDPTAPASRRRCGC